MAPALDCRRARLFNLSDLSATEGVLFCINTKAQQPAAGVGDLIALINPMQKLHSTSRIKYVMRLLKVDYEADDNDDLS